MNLLGLTGGVGMGKSTAANLLRGLGVAVIDTDDLARQLVEPGQPALAEIQARWGSSVIGPGGRLLRDVLAERVFADAQARGDLEAILHPRIRAEWLAQSERWQEEGRPVGVVVIPLLFETKAAKHFDAVSCTGCTAATQLNRLLARGWSPDQVGQRLAAQWPLEKKMALADFVVWTEGDLEVHAEQLKRVLRSAAGVAVGLAA